MSNEIDEAKGVLPTPADAGKAWRIMTLVEYIDFLETPQVHTAEHVLGVTDALDSLEVHVYLSRPLPDVGEVLKDCLLWCSLCHGDGVVSIGPEAGDECPTCKQARALLATLRGAGG